MLPRSGRVGTIYTSAAEVRDRSRTAHGAFYSTISLPDVVYNILAGKGLRYSCAGVVRRMARPRGQPCCAHTPCHRGQRLLGCCQGAQGRCARSRRQLLAAAPPVYLAHAAAIRLAIHTLQGDQAKLSQRCDGCVHSCPQHADHVCRLGRVHLQRSDALPRQSRASSSSASSFSTTRSTSSPSPSIRATQWCARPRRLSSGIG